MKGVAECERREEEEPLGGAHGAGGPQQAPPSLASTFKATAEMLLPSALSLHVDCVVAADKWLPPFRALERRLCPPLQPRIRRAAAGASAAPPSQACTSTAAPEDDWLCCCCCPCCRCCRPDAAWRALGCACPSAGRPRPCMGPLALEAAIGIGMRWLAFPACLPSKNTVKPASAPRTSAKETEYAPNSAAYPSAAHAWRRPLRLPSTAAPMAAGSAPPPSMETVTEEPYLYLYL